MKRIVFLTIITSLLSACGSGISGTYSCKPLPMMKDMFQEFNFQGKNVVEVKALGTKFTGKYKEDGDSVTVTIPGGQPMIFAKKGNSIESSTLTGTLHCDKQ